MANRLYALIHGCSSPPSPVTEEVFSIDCSIQDGGEVSKVFFKATGFLVAIFVLPVLPAFAWYFLYGRAWRQQALSTELVAAHRADGSALRRLAMLLLKPLPEEEPATFPVLLLSEAEGEQKDDDAAVESAEAADTGITSAGGPGTQAVPSKTSSQPGPLKEPSLLAPAEAAAAAADPGSDELAAEMVELIESPEAEEEGGALAQPRSRLSGAAPAAAVASLAAKPSAARSVASAARSVDTSPGDATAADSDAQLRAVTLAKQRARRLRENIKKRAEERAEWRQGRDAADPVALVGPDLEAPPTEDAVTQRDELDLLVDEILLGALIGGGCRVHIASEVPTGVDAMERATKAKLEAAAAEKRARAGKGKNAASAEAEVVGPAQGLEGHPTGHGGSNAAKRVRYRAQQLWTIGSGTSQSGDSATTTAEAAPSAPPLKDDATDSDNAAKDADAAIARQHPALLRVGSTIVRIPRLATTKESTRLEVVMEAAANFARLEDGEPEDLSTCYVNYFWVSVICTVFFMCVAGPVAGQNSRLPAPFRACPVGTPLFLLNWPAACWALVAAVSFVPCAGGLPSPRARCSSSAASTSMRTLRTPSTTDRRARGRPRTICQHLPLRVCAIVQRALDALYLYQRLSPPPRLTASLTLAHPPPRPRRPLPPLSLSPRRSSSCTTWACAASKEPT